MRLYVPLLSVNVLYSTSSILDFSRGSEHCAIAVCILECSVCVRDDKGNLQLLQKDEIWHQSLLQAVDREVVLRILLEAPNPVFKRCVLRSPGVRRSNNKDSIGGQHFL